jgi:hypothetical protein
VICGRITAGSGTDGGRSTWFSRDVAAQAVRNCRNWDTVKGHRAPDDGVDHAGRP